MFYPPTAENLSDDGFVNFIIGLFQDKFHNCFCNYVDVIGAVLEHLERPADLPSKPERPASAFVCL